MSNVLLGFRELRLLSDFVFDGSTLRVDVIPSLCRDLMIVHHSGWMHISLFFPWSNKYLIVSSIELLAMNQDTQEATQKPYLIKAM